MVIKAIYLVTESDRTESLNSVKLHPGKVKKNYICSLWHIPYKVIQYKRHVYLCQIWPDEKTNEVYSSFLKLARYKQACMYTSNGNAWIKIMDMDIEEGQGRKIVSE